jgi:hypothetical protein
MILCEIDEIIWICENRVRTLALILHHKIYEI